MARFLLGVMLGVITAIGYVRFELSLPQWLQIPDRMKGNLVSTATEIDLYDLDKSIAVRRRALEIYFDHRAADAARLDEEAGHPFLAALYRRRAVREARTLAAEWSGYDAALAKPELREVLERRYGKMQNHDLKQRMLGASLEKRAFLKRWIEQNGGYERDLLETLRRIGGL